MVCRWAFDLHWNPCCKWGNERIICLSCRNFKLGFFDDIEKLCGFKRNWKGFGVWVAQSPKNRSFDENADDYIKRTLAIYGILEAGFHEAIFFGFAKRWNLGCALFYRHSARNLLWVWNLSKPWLKRKWSGINAKNATIRTRDARG